MSRQSLSRLLGKVSGKVPLRTVLIVPFVVQIVGAVGLVGYLSFMNGQKAVNDLATRLRSEISDRIDQHLDTYFATPHQINQINRDAAELGLLDLSDLETTGRYFWKQMKVFDVGYICYGNTKGEYIGLERLENGNLLINKVSQPKLGKLYIYETDNQGNRTKLQGIKDWNPHTEAWYADAVKAGKPLWSKIYPWEDKPYIISISASYPISNKKNKIVGVLSIDHLLSQISNYLSNLKVSKSGKTFILERNGLLVGSSTSERPFKVVNGEAKRVKASESKDPLIRLTTEYLSKHFGNFSKIDRSQQLNFKIAGQRQFIQVTPWRDQLGLDWLIVVVVPEADFMAQINANTDTTIALCLAALVVAIIFCILTARWVTRPILRLNVAAKALAQGQWEQLVEIERSDELGELAQSFGTMSGQLKQLFTTLEANNSEMKALNEALYESESRLTQFLDAVPVGVTVHDATSKICYANTTAQSILGRGIISEDAPAQLAEVYQIYLADTDQLCPPERLPALRALKGETFTVDDLTIHQGEQIIPVEARATPIFDEKGAIAYAIVAFTDITQRKQAEAERIHFTEELERKNEALQHLDELKDEFLANTSHELRTPLNGMIGIAESMLDGATGKLSELQQKNLLLIAQSGRRLAALVNDILDFSKLKHKTIELQLKPVGMREIVEVVLNLSQPLIKNKNLQLINAIPSDLTPAEADENRLQQILYNLVGNAIKFTDSGIVEISANLQAGEGELGIGKTEIESFRKSKIQITVSDTGIGIPEDKLDRIFESFEQGDGSTAREYGGTGLGLAVTKKLVELHGGSIQVESTVGVGSRFRFTLTAALGQSSELSSLSYSSCLLPAISKLHEEESIQPLQITQEDKGQQFQILIVDDEPVNLQVLINHLSLQNYAITQATNGIEALAMIERGFKPDLVLLDVMMPRMTGYEVCQKLREQFPAYELPVVMLTAKNQVTDLVEGFSVGANDYLTKPISKNELFARIKTHLSLSNLAVAYGRFVPHQFLHLLNKESILDVQLGDHIQKKMSILFSDIRFFTTLSESMKPEDTFKFINAYLSRMESVIVENQGFIDKYIGDGIMALFSGSADDAVKSGITMLHRLAEYNQHRANSGYIPVRIGIGINTGSLMLGTVGGKNRMDGTVISDAVNIASRLETLTKYYGVSLLISHHTLANLQHPTNYSIRFIEQVKVKGKSQAVAVFEVFDGDEPEIKQKKLATKVTFEQALWLYNLGLKSEAAQLLKGVLKINSKDRVAQIYLERCQSKVPYEGDEYSTR
jgi:signal transduction histidine kinase/class 3 adenylate cyclase/ActR/RegA family two-component response regulator